MFQWVAIIFSSLYDDLICSTYITTREFLCIHLGVSENQIYYSATFYSSGLLLGGVLWNVLSRCRSVKTLLLLCQISLFITTISLLLSNALWQVFIIRFLQGFFGSGAFICINILVRHNFNQPDFNKFLALGALCSYASEAAFPLINGRLNIKCGFHASIMFLILILAVSMYTIFIDFKDPDNHESLKIAFIKTSQSYFNIINSKLVIILIMIGMSEGLVDLLFNVFDQMIRNVLPNSSNQVLTISLSVVSIFSSLTICIIPYFSNESDNFKENSSNPDMIFNWSALNDQDKKIMYTFLKIVFIVFITSWFNPMANHYVFLMIYMVLVLCMFCILHYIGIKILHSVYYSAGCVASSVSLSEALSESVISGISFFLIKIKDNRIIMMYILLYILLISIMLKIFYSSRNKSDKKTLQKS